MTAATSAVTSAIQSTRYAAIMHGYPYMVTFTTPRSYQIFTMIPPATTYSAVVSVGGTVGNGGTLTGTTPVPISSSGDIELSRTVSFRFAAGGTVTETSTPQNMVFQITSTTGASHTVTVSGVGNVSVGTP